MAVELVEPVKRVEQYLYALCVLDFSNIPVPRSRLEFFAHALITGVLPEFQAETREEIYITAIITGDYANLPLPKSRADQLLYKICLGETEIRDIELETRYEMLLAYIAEHSDMSLETVLVECVNALQTIPNTVEMPVKSAIFKGQTLVNLLKTEKNSDYVFNTNNWVVEDDYFKLVTPSVDTSTNWCTIQHRNGSMLRPNSKYLMVFDVKENSCNGAYNLGFDGYGSNLSSAVQFVSFNDGEIGIKKAIVTTSTTIDVTKGLFRAPINLPKGGKLTFRVMAIPYQEGMENWDIPYFEGMQSVKMPVLTTTGKNLIDNTSWESGRINNTTGEVSDDANFMRCIKYIRVKPSTTYVWKNNEDNEYKAIYEYGASKEYIGLYDNTAFVSQTVKFTTSAATNFIKIWVRNTTVSSTNQLEEGSTTTDYEPHKSNILSTPSDLELRGIGDVQDTLDLVTGEVTERIGSFNDWDNADVVKVSNYGLVSRFDLKIDIKPRGKIKANLFPQGSISTSDLECVGVHSSSQAIQTQVLTSKLSSDTVDGFKEWAKNNNYTVQYQLVESTVKTVDLTIQDQDGNAVPCLNTFNDATHVSINAVDIIPQVDLEVRVDANTMASVASQQENVAVAQASLSDAIDAQNDDIEMTKQALDEVKGE